VAAMLSRGDLEQNVDLAALPTDML